MQKTNRPIRMLRALPVVLVPVGIGLLFSASLVRLSGCAWEKARAGTASLTGSDPLAPIHHPRTPAERIVNGAKAEARRGVLYDASYRTIQYPGGDVRADRGACTDVVIRALRPAGYDLQALIHEDMQRHFSQYPPRYGLHGPDPNIDHRRVPNQIAFLRRHGTELPRSTTGPAAVTWQPGDLVYWRLPGGVTHCGVLSNVRDGEGLPLVIHNLAEARQEDCLTAWKITGHFRYPISQPDNGVPRQRILLHEGLPG
jgi:uncharacterized protein YijF (DUF1287 family)